jgi:hypothetical protein
LDVFEKLQKWGELASIFKIHHCSIDPNAKNVKILIIDVNKYLFGKIILKYLLRMM